MTISPYVIPGLSNSFRTVKKGYDASEIISLSCKFLDTTVPEIMKRDRSRFIVERRMLIMYYLFKKYGMNKSDIARMFSRDHTSVLHSLKTIEKLMDVDDVIRERWLALQEFIKS